VLHVDAAVLADDAATGRARLDGGPALSPAQARRTLCDARVLIMLEAGREVLAHGRTRRRASRAQRRALLRRDGRVIVTTPDGRRIRGAVDAAFSTGLDGLPVLSGPGTHGAETGAGHTSEPSAGCSRSDHPAFTGVHHSDGARARRPRVTAGPLPQPDQQAAGRRAGPKNSPASAGARPATVGGLLFPRGEPVPRRRCTSTAKG
jgi:hypothetical protein